ncbi:ABC transporter permease [Micromonospora sp. DR5-3]|uniref:ABC transporter permease n=1 Tax=unclassified Micromonospora TaxID=2617518 RepID=UPI0011D4133E|nr:MULTISPECIES: ABC transporter permease [unclassified Micromonospora]MCW3816346.1 ABC transporter permease [Micromonospora sp. DR5-3]TYC22776.1 ABC transporter permease [Micromonospora sp. MP36]
MFIAVRDLRFARGRFALLGTVIALMTLMVILLTGLTAGLGAASVSAVAELPVDAISFQRPTDGQQVSFATSSLPAEAVATVAAQPGVTAAWPLGASTTRLQADGRAATVALLGGDPALYPALREGQAPAGAEVALTADLAETQSVSVGDTVSVGGQQVTVTAIVATTSFNHLPVVYTPIDTWQRLARTEGITAVAATRDDGVNAAADPAGLTTLSRDEAFTAVGGYASEQGSLNLMRGLLLAVSALVVGAFFTVWTMQRGTDLAVVRALGGSRGYLLRDALAQAGIVLLVGAAVGAGAAAGLGAVAARVVPFVLDTTTVAVPLAAMLAVGALGAAFSVRRVSTVDPLTALGAAR